MKLLTVLFLSFFVGTPSFAANEFQTEEEVQKLFEESTRPDFAPYLKTAIPGRCFFKNPREGQTASVLLPIPTEDGFEIAPLSADKRHPTFFDKLSYEEIMKRFLQIKKLKREVFFTEEEIILYRTKGSREYQGKIRELYDYFFVKVVLKNLEVRYCYYNKK